LTRDEGRRAEINALKMEGASTSETSVNSYQATLHYDPEYSHTYTRFRENPRSCLILKTMNPAGYWKEVTD
jgi:hypothetical protein